MNVSSSNEEKCICDSTRSILNSRGVRKTGVVIDLLKKIGDKGINTKLSSVENPSKYKQLLQSEPELSKIADKLTV